MPPNPTTQRMGELHEEYLAQINGGTKTRSSGNQWHDQGDGRDGHDRPFAFCWDGKSTRAKQIAVTLEMIAKIREQAQGERPQIGLRWYGNDALDKVLEDWIAIPAADFEEMKLAAIRCAGLEAEVGDLTQVAALMHDAGEIQRENVRMREEVDLVTSQRDIEATSALHLMDELAAAKTALEEARSAGAQSVTRQAVESLREILVAVEADRDRYRELATAAQRGKLIPPYVPRLPWTVVFQLRLDGRVEGSGLFYGAAGQLSPFEVSTVRVERSLDSANRPRLIVNDMRVPSGDLYIDGKLLARVCADDASIEEG